MKLPEKNWLEWVVFGISLALVVGALGFLGYDALTTGEDPPIIEVRLGSPQAREYNYLVPVTVINHGDGTAEGVLIEVTLERDGEELESGAFEIPFLPRNSTGEGWVTFTVDPASASMTAHVRGYEKP